MHLKTDTGARQRHFSRVPTISKQRNAFSVAKKHITTAKFDYLYPVYTDFIYPGDTASLTKTCMARLATQVGTLYDDLYIDLHAWYVPMRLIQTDWARYQFNFEETPGQDNSSIKSPKVNLSQLADANGFGEKSLYDVLGYPTEADFRSDDMHVNNYEARAYNLIWNENYRDQNLQDPVVLDLDNDADNPTDYVLLKRGRRHDKFGSSLPFQQKGDAATVAISGSAPVERVTGTGNAGDIYDASTDVASGAQALYSDSGGNLSNSSGGPDLYYDPNGTLVANMSAITLFSINDIRTSATIQHLLEADARGGTRDIEAIQNR